MQKFEDWSLKERIARNEKLVYFYWSIPWWRLQQMQWAWRAQRCLLVCHWRSHWKWSIFHQQPDLCPDIFPAELCQCCLHTGEEQPWMLWLLVNWWKKITQSKSKVQSSSLKSYSRVWSRRTGTWSDSILLQTLFRIVTKPCPTLFLTSFPSALAVTQQ